MSQSSLAAHQTHTLDIAKIRADFPILQRTVHKKPLIYLDNAASSQKPNQVIEAVARYYRRHNANVHRGLHTLSEEATTAYESAREKVRAFINAAEIAEVIFTKGTTEAINLVASSYGRAHLRAGDEVLITYMEHHSNIVPWQMICEQTGAVLRVCPINERGELLMDEFERLLNDKTRIVAFNHISNSLGTVNPVKRMVQLAHAAGAVTLVDGAQAVPHQGVDVRDLDCDFYAFSGHKMFAPTGIGVLYGKRYLLEQMPPYQGGGDMIKSVSFEKTVYNELPSKFEAGTPIIAGAVGLGAAIDYLNEVGLEAISDYEYGLLTYGTEQLKTVPGLRMIGEAAEKTSVFSFVLDGAHPHDIGTILSHTGVAVRTGHHCTEPLMKFFKVPATVRASLAFYNTREEIDALVVGLGKVREMLL
ncbi:cysteine desulfurase [Acanthopleuribacter pedis]|uniref:Cysteine desulfurase n=1 Tax=Acanthopleuribacter pedis TaxID=442870 RepID=A0A8J7U689_9BACT|nr:cysteine desulfurase [Acanthopleuribacter pedis]MBO1320121.1 cysteine desulfurase [Acanthopleuribacter pedis]